MSTTKRESVYNEYMLATGGPSGLGTGAATGIASAAHQSPSAERQASNGSMSPTSFFSSFLSHGATVPASHYPHSQPVAIRGAPLSSPPSAATEGTFIQRPNSVSPPPPSLANAVVASSPPPPPSASSSAATSLVASHPPGSATTALASFISSTTTTTTINANLVTATVAPKAIPPPSNAPKYVKLNIGGTFHLTSVETLFKRGENMLSTMFSGRVNAEPDPDGWYIIDRDGRHFHYILNFLRDGRVVLPSSRKERLELLQEAKFYLLDDLVALIEAKELEESVYIPKCSVPVLTSPHEFKLILASTHRPIVVLNYNRGNNKYSYTANSDENFLRNAELFDKLSFKFNGRILYVKDIKCSNDILTWIFYGGGTKVAEICCVSLSYATEKKHTKVEFPEARIFEETLNVLLYEHGAVPATPHMSLASYLPPE